MGKHTEGPWKIEKCRCNHGSCNSYIVNGPLQSGHVFAEHDARLIASAPELLKICKAIQEWFEGESFQYNEELDKVINEAEGGEHE